MQAAVNYYLEHGRNISRTVRAVGYPSRETLSEWIDQLAPGQRKSRIKRGAVVEFTQEQKKEAVIEFCAREEPATTIATRPGVSRYSLYKWKEGLLGKGDVKTMNESEKPGLFGDREALLKEVKSLNRLIYKQQMELDILKKAAEIIKKARASIPGNWRTGEKPV